MDPLDRANRQSTQQQSNPAESICKIGDSAVVAALFGIAQAAVSQWKNGPIPDARLKALEVLFPEIFPPRPETMNGTRQMAGLLGVLPANVCAWAARRAKAEPNDPNIARMLKMFPEIGAEQQDQSENTT